jgi:antitoxin component YwqK of YwqJK toxin-antitoxin module
MNKIIVILTSLLLIVGCEKEVSSLQERNGVYYEINSEKGFTGNLIKKYPNGQKMSESNYKDGKLEGLVTAWDENGQKESEMIFKNGEKETQKGFIKCG